MHPLKSIQIKKTNDPTYGVWIVSTEADCEGRSAKRLGIYEGHIDEIALHLANKVMYSLFFSRYEAVISIPGEPTGANVSVNLSEIEQVDIAALNSMFSDRPISVMASNYYHSFEIVGDQDAIKRKIALSKLTKEERRILGL